MNEKINNRFCDKLIEKPKLAFFIGVPGDDKFLTDIYEWAKQHFIVKIFRGTYLNLNQIEELMKWSDISWFEWCTPLAVEASKLPKVCKTIIRLHRFEAFNIWPKQVVWENIDILITVGNSYVKAALLMRVPDLESRTQLVTIPNGVNLDKFKFVNRQQGKNIACIGYLNMRKNPMFLLQCMAELNKQEAGYKLFLAGKFQDPTLEQYYIHMLKELKLEDSVFFSGWRRDINSWLENKHFIVSGSIGEAHVMGIMEGMACGLKPVIHNFPGANETLPKEYLFNTASEFCQQICSEYYDSQDYRNYIEYHYSLQQQLDKISGVLL